MRVTFKNRCIHQICQYILHLSNIEILTSSLEILLQCVEGRALSSFQDQLLVHKCHYIKALIAKSYDTCLCLL